MATTTKTYTHVYNLIFNTSTGAYTVDTGGAENWVLGDDQTDFNPLNGSAGDGRETAGEGLMSFAPDFEGGTGFGSDLFSGWLIDGNIVTQNASGTSAWMYTNGEYTGPTSGSATYVGTFYYSTTPVFFSGENPAGENWTGDGGNDTAFGSTGNDTLDGSGGDDSLTGNDGNDVLSGYDGNDTIYGGAGMDTINGGNGNDFMYGGGDANTIYGGAGADTISGESGNDYIEGGDDNDSISGASGSDTVYGQAGNDTLNGGIDADTIIGGDGADWLDGQDGDDSIEGNGGNDLIFGSLGKDSVYAGDGDDNILDAFNSDGDYYEGGAGNDGLNSWGDADTLVGGTGNDRYSIYNYLDGGTGIVITENAGEGNDEVNVSGINNYVLADNVENMWVYLNGLTTLSVSGNSLDNIIWGADGALGTSTTIDGGEGNDRVLDGGGQPSNDNDSLLGGAGDDWLYSQNGVDTLVGGTGNDIYVINAAGIAAVIVEEEDEGSDTVDVSGVSSYTLTAANVENINGYGIADQTVTLTGNGGDNSIKLNSWSATAPGSLVGGSGNDTLIGSSYSTDTLVGGEGHDRYEIGNDTSDVIVELGDGGNDTIYISQNNSFNSGFSYTLTAENVENVTVLQTYNYTATLTGNGGGNVLTGETLYPDSYTFTRFNLYGGAGNDTLNGAHGGDSLFGGDDDDVLNGNAGSDALFGGAGNDVLNGGADGDYAVGGDGNDTLYGGAGNDTLYGDDSSGGTPGDDVLEGGDGNDNLYGGGGNDTLTGGAGSDSLIGGAGDDVYYYQAGDTLVEAADAGNDTVLVSNTSFTLADNFETLVGLSDGTVMALTGNSAANYIAANLDEGAIVGGAVTFTIAGGAGNDSVLSSAANDNVAGGDGDDHIIDRGGDDYISGDAGDDWLEGQAGIDTLTGGIGRDTLYGGDDADLLYGGEGNDKLVGNAGNDILAGNTGNDQLVGFDGNDTLNGGDGNDDLRGGLGNDDLAGGKGKDVLLGGNGADKLAGGAGVDTLTGGTGADNFVFDAPLATGPDVITDFNSAQGDSIEISSSLVNVNAGTLLAFRFTVGTEATTSSHRFVYDDTSGNLYYDADGSGAGSAVQFATLSNMAALTASDIVIA